MAFILFLLHIWFTDFSHWSGYNIVNCRFCLDRPGNGSYWDGIVITELDSTTGKPINPDSLYHAADNSCEAGNVMVHGDYYYLFFNRGSCCNGVNSTYYILMGRSTSPTGPFLDRDSVATNNRGGSVFLHSDGRYVGPGHFGYGEGKLTYHFYDGNDGGFARLGTGRIGRVSAGQ